MFRSTSFIFNGKPSEDYNLMIYFFDDDSMVRELDLGTNVEIVEDRLTNKPHNY